MTLPPGVTEATLDDLNRSAVGIIKLAESNGYASHAITYDVYDIKRGVVAQDSTKILSVVLNGSDTITAIWRDGRFAYARPTSVKAMLFGHMNHVQLKAAITGDWTSYRRCPMCKRWNAPCHCEDED